LLISMSSYQKTDIKIKIPAEKCRYFFLRFIDRAVKLFVEASFSDAARLVFLYNEKPWKKWKTMGKSINSEVSVVEK